MKINLASKKDRKQLLKFFKHYGVEEIAKNRTDCYLDHNFTVVAKDQNDIVGILQWRVKEDPRFGVVEFEEVNVIESYRAKGIGSLLVEYAVKSVKDYFKRIKINPRKIFLFVGQKNKIARNLYEKYDFKFICGVGNLFIDDEKELLYCLDLS